MKSRDGGSPLRPSFWTTGEHGLSGTQLSDVVRVLQQGNVVILPTDTIYGLHGIATDPAAVGRMFEIKARDERKPFVVLADTIERLEELGISLSSQEKEFLLELWPAPVTVILPLASPIAASAGSRSLAVRIPAIDWLRQLIARTGPLASTSVNRSGEEPLLDPGKLEPALVLEIAGVVDAGNLPGRPSTVLDLTGPSPRVVRQGDFAFTQNLWKTLRKTL